MADIEGVEPAETGQQFDTTATVHSAQVTTRNTRSSARGGAKANSVITTKPKTPVKRKTAKKNNQSRPTVASLAGAFDNMQEQASINASDIREIRGTLNSFESKFDKFLKTMERSAAPKGKQSNTSRRQAAEVISVEPDTELGNNYEPRRTAPVGNQAVAPVHNTPMRRPAPMPTPTQIVREQNRDGYIDTQMEREEYNAGQINGKPGTDGAFVKPYMYLDREGIQTERQKLDVRATMTYHEYVCCLLSLLHDNKSHDIEDRQYILAHFHAVAIDAITMPWPNVRRWTQQVWDHIEKGRCKWTSDTFIQNERVRLCYMSMPQQHTANASGHNASGSAVDLRYVLCREFNSIGGCRHNSSHDDGIVRYLHSCTHCDGVGRKSSHSYQRCRIRVDGHNNNQGSSSQYSDRQWQNTSNRQPTGNGDHQVSSQSHGNKYGGYQHHGRSKNV